MKKQLFSVCAITLVGVVLTLNSCKKEDTTAPVVTIAGGSTAISPLNATFTNPAATAKDEEDGDIATVTVTGTVDKNQTGDYTLTYTATDAAGNAGTATLVVTVRNDAYEWEGDYDATETDANGPYTYSESVEVYASETVNNRLVFDRFADFDNSDGVYMNITGTNIDVPLQTATDIGSGTATCDIASHTFIGTGAKNSTGFTLTYTDTKIAPCSGTRTGVVATFVMQ